MVVDPSLTKVDRVAGRLTHRHVSQVTWNVDRMYHELYLNVLKKNGIPVKEVTMELINNGRTERYFVFVDKKDVAEYIGRTPGCIRRDSNNQWYTKLFHVEEEWEMVKADWDRHPGKWREV